MLLFQDESILQIISNLFGWVYFLAWSLSFYPQAILNWRRKSVEGLSLDFVYLNVVGFLFYTIYNASLYWNETVRQQYRDRYGGQDNLVALNDVGFGLHAFVVSSFTFVQTLVYKGNIDDDGYGRNRRMGLASVFLPGAAVILTIYSALCLLGYCEVLDVLYCMGYLKVVITLIKYLPQLVLNMERHSTAGWSISNILLDLTGGVFSITQELLDGYIAGDISHITGNLTKLFLGLLSITFDLMFAAQHYILYSDRTNYYPIIDDDDDDGSKQRRPTDHANYA